MLDFRQLQIFMAVWQHRSLSRAAETVHLTQPTVSAHLKSLEEQLNVRLFDRNSREVVPTRAGHVLFPYIRQMVKLNQQAREALSGFLGEGRGVLEVEASNIPGQYLLPALLGRFKQTRPLIEIRLYISDTAAVAEKVQSGAIELGMTGAVISKKRLRFDECFSDELVFITHTGHPLASKKVVSFEEVMAQPMIMREKGSGTRLTVERALSQRDVHVETMDVVMEMGSTEAVRQGVKAGLGCSFISKRAIQDDLTCGLLHAPAIEDFSIRRKFYLVTYRGRTLSPVTQAFAEFIKAEAEP